MRNTVIFLLCGLLSGCATHFDPQTRVDTVELKVQTVALAVAVGVMAVSPDGQMVAWGDADLNLQNLQTGRHYQLHKRAPTALCWSIDGLMLAVTVQMDGESYLYVFDRNGAQIFKYHLPGLTGRLQWPRSGYLTASVLSYRTYSFGTNITGQLLQWDERWRLKKIPLYDTTITPSTAKILSGRLPQTFGFDLSPLKDEVLYTKVHAPPAFAASRRLMLRNLQTGNEKMIATLPLLKGGGLLAADGETALVNDGLGKITLQNLWADSPLAEWFGDKFDYDASSGLLATETGLFQADRLLVQLPHESRARLSSGGRFLLVNWRHGLYLLNGYPLHKIGSVRGVKMEKLQKLRRLRSRGLIEPDEYQRAREGLLQ